jgi:hypothetical protein
MTTAVFTRGSGWGISALYDDWGDNITPEQGEALGDLVAERFEELCAEAGDSSIYWQPSTSEVLGEVYGENTDEHGMWDPTHDVEIDLVALRNQANNEVWDALVCEEEDLPMTDRVRDILDDEN